MTSQNLFSEPVINSTIGISEQFNLTASDIEHRARSFTDENTLRLGGIRRVSDDVGHQILNIDTRKKDVDYTALAIPYFNIWNSNAILNITFGLTSPATTSAATATERKSRNTANREQLKTFSTFRR